ncbi:GAF domain-containing protein [bacterium]|nr:GAF domain-containing protein [bacterium]
MPNNGIRIEVPPAVLENWQEIADILAGLIKIPAALIMRHTHPDIEVFVSSRSRNNPYRPGAREILHGSGLYCERVLKTREKLLVPDALSDTDWKNNPDVKHNMIAYLGFPILLPNDEPFGTLCVLDNKRNEFSVTLERLMIQFRNLIQSHLEMIYVNQILGERDRKLTDYLGELQTLRGLVSICSNCKNIQDNQGHWIPIEHYLIRNPVAKFSHSICPECMKKLYPDMNDNQ